jgi:DNA-directed RNA polymerase subunit RPC12/RpoP
MFQSEELQYRCSNCTKTSRAQLVSVCGYEGSPGKTLFRYLCRLICFPELRLCCQRCSFYFVVISALLSFALSMLILVNSLQVLQVCEKNPRDEMKLNYDPRNPFIVCGATYTPIYRGSRDVSCPYCKARFVPETATKLCPVCDLAVVAVTPLSVGQEEGPW